MGILSITIVIEYSRHEEGPRLLAKAAGDWSHLVNWVVPFRALRRALRHEASPVAVPGCSTEEVVSPVSPASAIANMWNLYN